MVSGTIPWLRDFTDLPLGAYPNLGRYLEPYWKFDDGVRPNEFADTALIWRAEGAQILGGCCGVGPDHIRMLARSLTGTKPNAPVGEGHRELSDPIRQRVDDLYESAEEVAVESWTDHQGRSVYPLELPELVCDREVFVPTQGSHLL